MTFKDKLISKLIVGDNLTSYENGYNAALIGLYKEHIKVPIEKEKSPIEKLVSASQYKEIISYLRSGNKLQAVKLLKDITGLGLKEAKDLTDEEKYN